MKTRAEIKELAKLNMSGFYWPCVGTAFLVPLFLGACGSISLGLATLVLTGPMIAGMNYFFVQVFKGDGNTVDMGTPFSVGFKEFGRKLGGYWWMYLWTWLWSLLLVIPGIIKMYSYSMTMYILSDCPGVRAQDALKLSMRMMAGHKWELFVFQLSFIGWQILNGFTFGLLGIFYVTPYMCTSFAGFYLEVREEALRQGIITLGQLEGREYV